MATLPNPNSAAGKARAKNLAIAAAGKIKGLSSNQIAQGQQQSSFGSQILSGKGVTMPLTTNQAPAPGGMGTTPPTGLTRTDYFGDVSKGAKTSYTGEGVQLSNKSLLGLKPGEEFKPVSIPTEMQYYGQAAKEQEAIAPGTLENRNDIIATNLYGMGAKTKEDIKGYMEKQGGFLNSTPEDRQNTIEAIAARMGITKDTLSVEDKLMADADVELADLALEKDKSNLRKLIDNVYPDEVRQLTDDELKPLAMQVGMTIDEARAYEQERLASLQEMQRPYNQEEEDAKRDKLRNEEDAQLSFERSRQKIFENQQDIRREADRGLQNREMVGALKGYNESLLWRQGLATIDQDAERLIGRLETDIQNQSADLLKYKTRLSEDFTTSMDRLGLDFKDKMKDMRLRGSDTLNTLLEKYSPSEDILTTELDKFAKEFGMKGADIMSKYVSMYKEITNDAYEKELQIANIANIYSTISAREASMMPADQRSTVMDIMAAISAGKITKEQAMALYPEFANYINPTSQQTTNQGQIILGETPIDTGYANMYGGTVKLAPTVNTMFQAALTELEGVGKFLGIGDSTLSHATKQAAYDKWVAGGKVGPQQAPADLSFHVKGQAFDIQQNQMNDPDVINALLNAGFTRPVKSEPFHRSYGEGPDAFTGQQTTQTQQPTSEDNYVYGTFFDGLSEQGKQAFNTMNDEDRMVVMQLVDGDALLSDIVKSRGAAGTEENKRLLALATRVDPAFSVTTNAQRFNYKKQFNAPNSKPQVQIGGINTALGHLAELKTSADALNTKTLRAYNSVANMLKKETNDPAVATFDYTINQLATEIATAYKGGVPDQGEIDRNYIALTKNLSPNAISAVYTRAAEMLAQKIATIGQQYKSVMGRYPDPNVVIMSYPIQQLIDAGIDVSKIQEVIDMQSNTPGTTQTYTPQTTTQGAGSTAPIYISPYSRLQ